MLIRGKFSVERNVVYFTDVLGRCFDVFYFVNVVGWNEGLDPTWLVETE